MNITISGPTITSFNLTKSYTGYDYVSSMMAEASSIMQVPVGAITLSFDGVVLNPSTAILNFEPEVVENNTLELTLTLTKPTPLTTQFYVPLTISQVNAFNYVTNTDSIDWNINNLIVPGNSAYTKAPVYSRAGFWQERFRSVTSEIWCTNLGIPDNNRQVLGIELLLDVQRAARIQDLIIQLTLGGELIGNNYASVTNPVQSDTYTADTTNPDPVGDSNIYGGPRDTWGTTLTSAQINDPTFGIVISFQSNIIYPHSDTMYVDQVGIRVTYA